MVSFLDYVACLTHLFLLIKIIINQERAKEEFEGLTNILTIVQTRWPQTFVFDK